MAGEPTTSPEALLAVLREQDPGDTVPMVVRGADGTEREVEVTLTERPAVSE